MGVFISWNRTGHIFEWKKQNKTTKILTNWANFFHFTWNLFGSSGFCSRNNPSNKMFKGKKIFSSPSFLGEKKYIFLIPVCLFFCRPKLIIPIQSFSLCLGVCVCVPSRLFHHVVNGNLMDHQKGQVGTGKLNKNKKKKINKLK